MESWRHGYTETGSTMRRLGICQGWRLSCRKGGDGSTSSTCKNVLALRTQTQTQLSRASMRVSSWGWARAYGQAQGSTPNSLSLLLSLLGEASHKRCSNGSGNNATVDDAGQIVERPCECSAVLGSSRDQAKLGLTSLRFSSLHAVFV